MALESPRMLKGTKRGEGRGDRDVPRGKIIYQQQITRVRSERVWGREKLGFQSQGRLTQLSFLWKEFTLDFGFPQNKMRS